MTRNEILALLQTAESDFSIWLSEDDISVDVIDFIGFNNHGDEEFRALDNPAQVRHIQNTLKKKANSIDDEFYVCYHFDNCTVTWGYTSYDI